MGLLHSNDWKAKWIRWKNPEDDADRQGIRWIWVHGQDALAVVPKTKATFRVTVELSQKAKEAILLLATRGDFVAKVNGHEVDAKGGWTTFDRRDISDELVVGKNEIEVTVTAPEAPEVGPEQGSAGHGGRTGRAGKDYVQQRDDPALSNRCKLEGESRKDFGLGIGSCGGGVD